MFVVHRLASVAKSSAFVAGAAIASTLAFGALAQASTPEGIYVVAPLLEKPNNPPLNSSFYARPDIDGINLPIIWGVVNPLPGSFDWRTVDTEVKAAVAHNKKIEISIVPNRFITDRAEDGTRTMTPPDWIFDQGAAKLQFVAGSHDGIAHCDVDVMSPPWDPVYLSSFVKLINALQKHLQTIPGANDAVSIVKIAGINEITAETHLPIQRAPVPGYACQSTTDAVAQWQAAGYTPTKIVDAWHHFAGAFAAAFPNALLTDEFIDGAGAFPPINEQGTIVTADDPSYVDVTWTLMKQGLALYPQRFAVQWDGLGSDRTVDPIQTSKKAQNLGAIVGWQTNLFQGHGNEVITPLKTTDTLNIGTGCNGELTETQPCSLADYRSLINAGIGLGAQYLEVWPTDASGFPSAIATIHARLFPVASN